MCLPPSILKISHQLDLMQHTLKYFYLLQRKLVIFDPSYRRDFRGFCINKVGRDPPIEPYIFHYEIGGAQNRRQNRSTCIE